MPNVTGIDPSEETECSWKVMLADFDREVWPWFKKHGYKKDTALLVWVMNQTLNEVVTLNAMLTEE